MKTLKWIGKLNTQTNMKKLFTLLALVLCSCSETFVSEQIAKPIETALPDLNVAFAEEDVTRTYIEAGKYLRWHADDRLTIFYGTTLNRQYKFNGKTGANSGSFSHIPSGNIETGNSFDNIYAIYPYNEDIEINDITKNISLTLPAEQYYAENSFGIGANTMVAVTESTDDTYVAFKNACGYLKLKLYGDTMVKSIIIKGNNNEKIAGAATIDMVYGGTPVLTMANNATNLITLSCGSGIMLNNNAPTEFWIVIPPVEFSKGFTIYVNDNRNMQFEQTTTNNVIINRNEIQPMAAIEVVMPAGSNNIEFADKYVKKVCVEKYDMNGDGELSYKEAAEVKSIPGYFFGDYNTIVKSFNELQYFTNVTEFSSWAFNECSALSSIAIPERVTSIGYRAFYWCPALENVYISNLSTWCGINHYEYDQSSHPLYTDMLSSNYKTRNLYINGELATEITIPSDINSIKYKAFYNCKTLKKVIINDNITTIGESAFHSCENLESIVLPKSLTRIENYTFNVCKSLVDIEIPDSVIAIGDGAFNSCYSLESIYIPQAVETIGGGAFSYCDSLTGVTIGDNVFKIGGSAFYACKKLSNVIIGNGVINIGGSAFGYCSSLTSITIPDSVTAIGSRAFYLCSSLTSVYCKATTPPTIETYSLDNKWSAFYGNDDDRKIYVPMESVDAYKSAEGWSDYADAIVGYDF